MATLELPGALSFGYRPGYLANNFGDGDYVSFSAPASLRLRANGEEEFSFYHNWNQNLALGNRYDVALSTESIDLLELDSTAFEAALPGFMEPELLPRNVGIVEIPLSSETEGLPGRIQFQHAYADDGQYFQIAVGRVNITLPTGKLKNLQVWFTAPLIDGTIGGKAEGSFHNIEEVRSSPFDNYGVGTWPDESLSPTVFSFAEMTHAIVEIHETLVGTNERDVITGARGRDTITGLSGDDKLSGNNGEDDISGGGGADRLYGGGGDDFLKGNGGDDKIIASDGDDVIKGGGGDDIVKAGAGDDILEGQIGNDNLKGGSGDDDLVGGKGEDVLTGNGGEDLLSGQEGDDSLFGGAGNDRLKGGADNDLIEGGGGTDVIEGGGGNDSIEGGRRRDVIDGGSGDDTIEGGSGDDTIEGGSGDDILKGGLGDDTFGFVEAGFGNDEITDFRAAKDLIAVAFADDLVFTDGEGGLSRDDFIGEYLFELEGTDAEFKLVFDTGDSIEIDTQSSTTIDEVLDRIVISFEDGSFLELS